MEEIADVELVLDPLVVLGHVPLNGGELSIGVEVAEDGYGNEGEEEEGEGHFEDGDLLVVDVGVDGRKDLLYIQRVLQLLDLEHAHILLLLVRHLPITVHLIVPYYPLELSLLYPVGFNAVCVVMEGPLLEIQVLGLDVADQLVEDTAPLGGGQQERPLLILAVILVGFVHVHDLQAEAVERF